ncbi:sulfatase-like hydrolase/transferase [Shewanella kaireitica]|uniref:sulfatase-like hydrolase/transferase n=1 Tax=Shewanella kaireitica TaxID=212021 RepID=UPI002010006B|nr:sulfatase-like hydrolase/transferase [Shewanella kaireitica]MCL1095270.1 sulfatase-like hydrolase/transferase [Shewanella kaireitica]
MKSNSNNSSLRILLRTFGVLLLFTVMLVNYRSSILPYSAFSIANAMTHLDFEHFNSIGLIKDIMYFFIILLLLHVVWAMLITTSFNSVKDSNSSDLKNELTWLLLVLSHLTFVVGLNSYLYPTSITAYFRNSFYSNPMFLLILGVVLLVLFIIGVTHYRAKNFIFTTVLASTLLLVYPLAVNKGTQTSLSKPNILIVGVDGLRPDHLSYAGAPVTDAPFINNLLSNSYVYRNSYSPQGRTYVAWMSILTGQYPKTNGARFNLAPPELINKNLPIIESLNYNDYHTVYAMDERRFNQIDRTYGFSSTIGPKIGAADAFISSFADLPIINTLLNHPYSGFIFPYLHNNRAYGKTYQPKLFNNEVISSLSTTKPNFLAVHFCQLHWPYTSNDFIDNESSSWDGNYSHFMYKAMLKKVDQQLAHFFAELKEKNYLENSIVYLISDHGEGFKLSDSFNLEVDDNAPAPQSWGHGTNILDQAQANVLLARMQFANGEVSSDPKIIEGLFSLIDILPTINKQLKLNLVSQFDGYPLPTDSTDFNAERHLFVESSLPLKAMNASFIDEKKVVSEVGSSYTVRSSGKAVMKPQEYLSLVSRKQRSVYQANHQLALLPESDSLVLVDFANKDLKVINDDENNLRANKLLTMLCQFYKDDYGFDETNRCLRLNEKGGNNG